MINSISDFNINYEKISQEEELLVIEGLLIKYQNEYNNAIGSKKVYYFQIIKALKSVLGDLKQKQKGKVKAKNTL